MHHRRSSYYPLPSPQPLVDCLAQPAPLLVLVPSAASSSSILGCRRLKEEEEDRRPQPAATHPTRLDQAAQSPGPPGGLFLGSVETRLVAPWLSPATPPFIDNAAACTLLIVALTLPWPSCGPFRRRRLSASHGAAPSRSCQTPTKLNPRQRTT
ncbi:hypothetical protein VTN77DRAFT_7185 [Rasamsonia byssochlamydoides]|uniref:uncharacterized protein n=1 Tax=Rasamsonia byssochlamydoides TaxID=89139 RepID=UPI003744024A